MVTMNVVDWLCDCECFPGITKILSSQVENGRALMTHLEIFRGRNSRSGERDRTLIVTPNPFNFPASKVGQACMLHIGNA